MKLGVLVVISVLLFLGVVVYNRLFLKIRISQYLQKEQEKRDEFSRLRQEMARDFHDEMGNHLASIINMVNVLKLRLKACDDQTQTVLDKIEQSSKSLFDGTREFMWTIDPENDNMEDILVYLRDYGVEFFSNTSIEFVVGKNLISNVGNLPVITGSSRHIIAIFKEAMTNCLKHSGAQKVTLDTIYNGDSLSVRVTDDGQGLRGRMGRGLKNMQIRALKVNAILKCESFKNGFTVELKFNNPKIGI